MAEEFQVSEEQFKDWFEGGVWICLHKRNTTHLDSGVRPAFQKLLDLCKEYHNARENNCEYQQREVEKLWTDDRFGLILQRSWPNGPKLPHPSMEEESPSREVSVGLIKHFALRLLIDFLVSCFQVFQAASQAVSDLWAVIHDSLTTSAADTVPPTVPEHPTERTPLLLYARLPDDCHKNESVETLQSLEPPLSSHDTGHDDAPAS
jgi:hypothetical protein